MMNMMAKKWFEETEQLNNNNDDDDIMTLMMIMVMAKTYLKWVGQAEQLDDKQGEVFQFRRGD